MYDENYCIHYINQSTKSAYFNYKNSLVAKFFKDLNVKKVVDLGSNVNSILKNVGLRHKLENFGIDYLGLDLDPSYFSVDFIKRINVPELNIYTTPKGIVGNIEKLPFKDNSIEAISVLDVLEHVEKPLDAVAEMNRVLVKDGYAIFVLPSLYKLDLLDFDYIEEKRKSSHLSKMTIFEWQKIIETKGFILQKNLLKPIGVLSGLSYLLWLDRSFIPNRILNYGNEIHDPISLKHKEIKSIFSKYDSKTDAIFDNKFITNNFIVKIISNPNILNDIFKDFPQQELIDTISAFVKLLGSIDITSNILDTIKQKSGKLPYYALANSSMLVYKNGK